MGKERKKFAEKFQVLLSGEFYGAVDSWTEYLCLARNPDGSIILSSRSREILAEAARYREKDFLPATTRRKEVWGFDGDYVVGQKLLPHDGGAEVTVQRNEFDVAAEWLRSRKWDRQPEFGEAWARIRSALSGPEFFSPARPLPLLGDIVPDGGADHGASGHDAKRDGKTPFQPGGRKPREIVVRCAGPSKPWVVWLELVFIEWPEASYSVYARTGEAVSSGAESPGLMPRIPGRLGWRAVLEFVQTHDLATVSRGDPRQIDVYGVEPWQRDVIAAAMMRISTIVPFLGSLSDEELGPLHERLGGFLSEVSGGHLSWLAAMTRSPLLAGKSLAAIARLVGSPDPFDAGRLAEDCSAYLADRNAEEVLAQYGGMPAPPQELFLSLSRSRRPRSPRLRAGLFDLWMRTKRKPKGGAISGMNMDDELPVIYWLLRNQAAEVFRLIAGNRHDELQGFVPWFLGKARRYARYFTGRYRFDSFVVYAYGRPRFAAWARLGKEVQEAAAILEIAIPASVRLPAMPDLEEPTIAFQVSSEVPISPRRLRRIAEQLAARDPGKPKGNQ